MTDTEIQSQQSVEQQPVSQQPNENQTPISDSTNRGYPKEDKGAADRVEVQDKHRTFTREEVAKIANAERKQALEKGRLEALEELKRKQAEPVSTSNQISEADFKEHFERQVKLAAEAEREKEIQSKMDLEARDFVRKLDLENDAESRANFEKLNLGKFKITREHMPYIHILNSVDNAKEVLGELAKYPEKLTTIFNTAMWFGLDQGKEAMRRLSESIKVNQQAAKVEMPKAPLSQVSPSNTGVDNGNMTAADFRKMYRGKY